MNDDYESWLESELKFRRKSMLNRIEEIEHVLMSLKDRVESDKHLNDLGELQSSGVMLDTAIAAYATQRQALLNYREMRK